MRPSSKFRLYLNTRQWRQRTPGEHYCTYPDRWTHLLQDHVARNFEENVRDEEHKQCDIVVFSFHFEVFCEPLYPSIANVDAG